MNPIRILACAAPVLAVLAAGCGGDAGAARPPDREAARQVLQTALDAWKGGQSHDAPAKADTPVRVADEDWLAGSKLVDFQIEPEAEEIGSSMAFPVTLTLDDARGRPSRRRVTYNVAVGPPSSVIRQD